MGAVNPLACQQLSPTAQDAATARSSSRALSRYARAGKPLILCAGDEKPVELPAATAALLVEILEALAAGQAVTLLPEDAELTAAQAADILNVSRPYLMKLLDDQPIPHRKVGRDRRVRLQDIMAYKAARSRERKDILTQLTREAQEQGMGYTT